MKDLLSIVSHFQMQGTVREIKPLGSGLINDTYKVTTVEADAPDYVLQRINHAIFQNVEMLQSNIEAVTGHIRKKLEEKGEKYDVVILDPPAFTKSRKTIKNATKGYREINMRGMKLVKPGGYLATCSCSHFMDYELFTKTIHQAAQNVHKRIRQVEYRTQAPYHPILWSAEESYYLKFYVFQIVDEK